MPRPPLCLIGLVAAAWLVAGCAGEDAAARRRVEVSWIASALLVGESWVDRRVPTAYAEDALRVAGEALRTTPAGSGPAAPADRVQRMAALVRRDDRPAMRAELERLSAELARRSAAGPGGGA